MRFCIKCLECKELSAFSKASNSFSGLRADCKSCRGKNGIYIRPVQNKKANQKRYFEKNKEKIKQSSRAYHAINREKKNNKASIYRDANRQKIRDMSNAWYHANKEKVFAKLKEKRNSNPFFKMKGVLKKRIQQAFKYKSWKKDGKTREILGAEFETVKKHIERQFKKGMTWENYGRYTWHIDHKIPLASAKTEEEMIILCHYTNLQPMWAQENIIKSDTIVPTQMTMHI